MSKGKNTDMPDHLTRTEYEVWYRDSTGEWRFACNQSSARKATIVANSERRTSGNKVVILEASRKVVRNEQG